MAKRLKVTTLLPAEPGSPEPFVMYGPDDDVPAAHAKLIGDHAWEDGSADEGVDDDGIDSREAGTVPPRGGAGSGVEEWRSFARENGVSVGDEESRDSIIGKCEDAGLVEKVD